MARRELHRPGSERSCLHAELDLGGSQVSSSAPQRPQNPDRRAVCVWEAALLPAHTAAPVQQPGQRPTHTALAICMTCERRALGVHTTAAHSEQRSSAKPQPSCCAPCFPDRPGRIHAAQCYSTSAGRRTACCALFAAAVQASQNRVHAPLLQRWPLRPGSTDCCVPPERQNPDPKPLSP